MTPPRELKDPSLGNGSDTGDEEEADRAAILARRQALVRRSLASLGGLVLATATNCMPEPCLRPIVPTDATDVTDAGDTGTPMPCLSRDVEPPRGDVQEDAATGDDAGSDGATRDASEDAAPMPCLVPPLPDAADVAPMPCLSPPIDGG